MTIYLLFSLMGIITGSIFALLFFQTGDKWFRLVASLIGLNGNGTIWFTVRVLVGNKKKLIIACSCIDLISFIITAIIVFFLLCRTLRDKDGKQIIKPRDIFFGQKKFIDECYTQFAEEIKNDFYSKEVEEEKQRLNTEKISLLNQEKDIASREEKLKEQTKNAIVMKLPIEASIPVTNDFLGQFPDFIDCVAKFINDVNHITDDYIVRCPNDDNKYSLLRSYLLSICSFTIKDLFETSSDNVRIHFRILKNNQYIKFIAQMGGSIYEEELTPMPKNKGMIKQSSMTQTSLIKSLNYKYDVSAKHRNKWEDYMTITFTEICKDKTPYLSMGISVKNKEKFKHLLYFLNFFKIENFLQEQILEIDKVYNIVNTIENGFNE
nr:hypothetical protein [uncultured Lachnoclostridium sp.]